MQHISPALARQLARVSDRSWHARVWHLTWPVILANLSAPLVGTVDTAVMGRMPNADYIAAVALGAMVFSAVYWLFGFLRMGTTALTAQALGAGAHDDIRTSYVRGVLLALGVAAVLLGASALALPEHVALLGAAPGVTAFTTEYLQIRVWGTPAYLLHLVQLGVLFGTQRMATTMVLALLFNLLNLVLDVVLVLGFGWGVAGVAWGTVCSEWVAAIVGGVVVWRYLDLGRGINRAAFWLPTAWRKLLGMSGDLLLRTFFVQLPFLLNVLLATRLGSTVLAGNAILMQFFFIVSYALDGYAHTAEALTGYAVGARSRAQLQAAARYCGVGAAVFAVVLTVCFTVLRDPLLALMTNLPDVAASATRFYPWFCALPMLGIWAFLFDGIYIGAGAVRDLRNAMFVAAAAYLAIVGLLFDTIGNHALWLGMLVFMAVRGVLLARRYPDLLRRVVPA